MTSLKKTFLNTSIFTLATAGIMGIWYLIFIEKSSLVLDIDTQINNLMGTLHESDIVNQFFIFASQLFDPKVFLAWFLILIFLLFWRGFRYEALFLFFGVAGGQVIKITLKFLTDRTRPENPFELSAHESSFPSGHSTTAVFFCLAIIYLFTQNLSKIQKIFSRIFLISLALSVAFSRIFVQVHYFSDVKAGILLGIASLSFTILVFDYAKEKGYL